MIKDVCKMEVVPDGLVFDPETVKRQRIKEDADKERSRGWQELKAYDFN
jgi:hypothetical protein